MTDQLTISCSQCGTSFMVTGSEVALLDKISPTFSGAKYHLPKPTKCPRCRRINRLAFRNERKLYKRNCDATGKSIISIYSPDKPYKVYDFDYWWSDAYDPLVHGMEYNPNRSFMQQYAELILRTPKLAIHNSKSENSAYTNYAFGNKDCYLISGSAENQNCYYAGRLFNCSDCIDCFGLNNCQNCYECSDSVGLYGCVLVKNSENSRNLALCDNCDNCSDCYGCINLSGKQFHFFNEPLSKDEYQAKVASISLSEGEARFREFLKNNNSIDLILENCEQSSGNMLLNCKNCESCYSVKESESAGHVFIGSFLKDVLDCNFVDKNELAYNGTNMNNNNHVIGANLVWGSRDVYYCSLTFNCDNVFGCSCIKQASYCILNKQYTKEEYEDLVPKIIAKMIEDGEWGEYFPAILSPFGVNETIASDYEAFTPESAKKSGFNWSEFETPFPKVEKIIPANRLPADISKIPDDILNWALECEASGKPFRILKPELEFYRKHNLGVPRLHPDERHLARMNARKQFNP